MVGTVISLKVPLMPGAADRREKLTVGRCAREWSVLWCLGLLGRQMLKVLRMIGVDRPRMIASNECVHEWLAQ